jgi:glutaredoxin 3
MYSTAFCPYCIRARALLDSKGVSYRDIRIDIESQFRVEMERRSGRTSVPQIFVGDTHIGGFDDMYALERRGTLDALLRSAAPGEAAVQCNLPHPAMKE